MSMDELNQLYQQVILDHSCEYHGSGALDTPDATSHQVSPTYGDDVTLEVRAKDGRIEAIDWEGDGYSVSQASISVMHSLINGTDLATVARLGADFDTLMHSHGKSVDDAILDDLGDGIAFEGVSKYPNRVKCVLLGWMVLKDALAKSGVALPTVEPNDPEQPDRLDTTVRSARKKEEVMGDSPSGMPAAADNPMVVQQPSTPVTNTRGVDVAVVKEALRNVIGPELGINVIGLDLLYGVSIEPDDTVALDVILITAACPLADIIEEQVQQALSLIADKVHTQWVWLSPWGPDKIAPKGREQSRALGFNI